MNKIASKIISIFGFIYVFILLYCSFNSCYGNIFEEEKEKITQKFNVHWEQLQQINNEVEHTPISHPQRRVLLRDKVETGLMITLAKASCIFAGYSSAMFYIYYTNENSIDAVGNSMPIIFGMIGGILLGEIGSYFVNKNA